MFGIDIKIILITAGILVVIIAIIAAAVVAGKRKTQNNANKKSDTGANTNTNKNREPSALSKAVSKNNINYDPIVEIARAISNNDQATVEKMRLLARNYPEFIAQNQFWCESAAKDFSAGKKSDKDALVTYFFAQWMSGYTAGSNIKANPSGKFGCYITGNEKTKEIIDMFDKIDKCLNYGLDLKNINLFGVNNITQLISAVNTALTYKRYCLISFETEPKKSRQDGGHGGHYLFIIAMNDHDRIAQNASKVKFNIYRQILA